MTTQKTKNKKDFQGFTLRGKVRYSTLIEPKMWSGSQQKWVVNCVKGAYSIVLDADTPTAKEMIEKLEGLYQDAFREYSKEHKEKGKTEVLHQQKTFIQEKDGKTSLNFKRNAVNSAGDVAKIGFKDAFKKDINLQGELGTRSDVVVRFTTYFTPVVTEDKKNINFYMTLCLLDVQIITHVPYDSNDDWCVDVEEVTDVELIGEDSIPF